MPLVRDFRRADQDAVRTLIQDGLRSRWGTSFDPTVNPDTDDLAAYYLAPGGEITVVEDDGLAVATGILCVEPSPDYVGSLTTDPTVGRLRRISVSGTHRRRGFGRIVVENLVRRAADRNLTVAVVSTDTPWTDAVALYQSCGFRPVHEDPEETHLVRMLAGE